MQKDGTVFFIIIIVVVVFVILLSRQNCMTCRVGGYTSVQVTIILCLLQRLVRKTPRFVRTRVITARLWGRGRWVGPRRMLRVGHGVQKTCA